MSSTSTSPIPEARLHEIVQQACDTTFANVSSYNHADTETQNAQIINTILTALVSPQITTSTSTTSTTTGSTTESSTLPSPPASPSATPTAGGSTKQYKYAVNSTIIQHLLPSTSHTSTTTSTSSTSPQSTSTDPAATTGQQAPHPGRRGMHSATGAYWDKATDGMFSYKWEGASRGKGMDVVVLVVWVGV